MAGDALLSLAQHGLAIVHPDDAIAGRIVDQRDAGADADVEDAPADPLGRRAPDDSAAEHARLTGLRIIEHAGLTGRYAILAGDQLDLDAARAMPQPGRLRRPGRANLDEDLAAIAASPPFAGSRRNIGTG